MKSWPWLGGIFVLGIVFVAWIRLELPTKSEPAATLDIEIAKAILAGCVVAVIGAVVNILVKGREQRMQDSRLEAELLRQILQQLGKHYRSVKAIRRRLRSYGLTTYNNTPPDEVKGDHLKVYTESMVLIEKAQFTMEDLQIQVSMLPPFSKIREVASGLHDMEEYLHAILKERDIYLPKTLSEGSILFADLKRLIEFTSGKGSPKPDEKHYRFDTHFSQPYHGIWGKIAEMLP